MPTNYNGLAHMSGATFFFAQRVYPLHHSNGAAFIWIAHNTTDAKVAQNNLQSWIDPQHIYVIDPGSTDSLMPIVALAEHRPGVFIVQAEHYELLSGLVGYMKKNVLTITHSSFESPLTLAKKLVSVGYEKNGEGPGSFIVRGDTITIEPVGKNTSVRVQLEYDQIDAIQENGEDVTDIGLYPAVLDFSSKAELLNIPIITTNVDILNSQLPEKITNTIISLNFLKGDDKKVFKKVQSYTKQSLALFVEKANQYLSEGYEVYVQSIDDEILSNVFSQFSDRLAEEIQFIEQYPDQDSFVSEELHAVFWTQKDIFGPDYLRPHDVEKKELDFLSNLEEGAYVTHSEHGIGVYRGVVETQIDGYARENILIEYAKGDKLYVPIEQLNKVDKYVGAAKPKVNRLSGGYWNRTRTSVSQDVKKLARELVSIYARRSISYTKPFVSYTRLENQFARAFPYTETPDQKACIQKVNQLLQRDTPMDTLIVGDVGFGKTEVAIRAAYKAVLNEKQVVFLAPTTILAQQHYDNLVKRFDGTDVRIGLLSRFVKKLEGVDKERETVRNLAAGNIDIIVSTHRIFSKDITMHSLGLVIIDEEQRFGVKHKESLKQLKRNTHVLTLSATPIPRTLYFSLAGIRELCRIDTPPPGRKPVKNQIAPLSKAVIKTAITAELARKGQVYYLHNRVETIDTAAMSLRKMLGRKVRVGVLHGQMDEEDIASVMHEFDLGTIDVLVCSTIIENGLDLPNVNTLIVTDAQKLGLGQLYQLRGRVGRSERQAHAYFLYNPAKVTPTGVKRLEALEEADELASGYKLANRDLEIRGAGNLLGKSQHGHVKSVGLSVYTQMLDQAVSLYLGDSSKETLNRDIRIELPMAYEIPHYIEDSSKKRLKMYRELTTLSNEADVSAYFKKHFKGIRDELIHNLEFFVLLRIKASEKDVADIRYTRVNDERLGEYILLYIEYRSHRVTETMPPQWEYSDSKTIRFKATDDDAVLHQLKRIFSIKKTHS